MTTQDLYEAARKSHDSGKPFTYLNARGERCGVRKPEPGEFVAGYHTPGERQAIADDRRITLNPAMTAPYGVVTDLTAKSTQVGGTHYNKLGIQPVDYIFANNLGFCEGNVIKYVTRHEDKGGAEDLRKAIHFLNLLLEHKYKDSRIE